uniref:uncharacterized protein n=1 Tax=Centroberyx gerrardi TaxID=166262 RepID=UPI003AAB97E8
MSAEEAQSHSHYYAKRSRAGNETASCAQPLSTEPDMSDHEEATPPPFRCGPPMGCAERYSEWRQNCSLSEWMDKTLKRGYALQFSSAPPAFNGVMESAMRNPQDAAALSAEIKELLGKGAITTVPPEEVEKGFYSRYFLVPKKTGGVRPILDLRSLNNCIVERPFHMLTTKHLLECVQPGDWLTTIDLKDAYFHVPILPKHRKFLRFAFQGTAYEYQRIAFGYSLAPRTFSKCVETALEPLRRRGLRILFYLDDLILMAPTEELAMSHTAQLVRHISLLGFAINWKKSSPTPSQQAVYLGIQLDSSIMRAKLTELRQDAIRAALQRCQALQSVTVLSVMHLLGLMSAAHVVVPLGLLHMRLIQRWFAHLRVDPRRHKRRLVTIPLSVKPNLDYWESPQVMRHGVPMGRVMSHISVFTDASLSGWGGTCLSHAVGGTWPESTNSHINVLELSTVLLVLNHFAPLIRGRDVLIRTDNQTTAAYINRQGGVRSAHLLREATELWLWAHTNLRSMRALHIPGILNKGADLMSRGGPRNGEWRLHPDIVQQIWSMFGRAEVDLFASRENTHCPLWFSLRTQDESPLGIDAFAHRPWPQTLLYAFPPVPLIPRVLSRVRAEKLSVILIAPERISASWFPEMSQLLSASPWPIPWRMGALSQVGLAPERDRLERQGLPPAVINTIQSARAASTTALYTGKWLSFQRWCEDKGIDPVICPVNGILMFLQMLFDRNLAPSTLKVYASAISSCHEGFGDKSVFSHPLVRRFLQGARRKRPVSRVLAPQWDLPLVLQALSNQPFEPIAQISLKWLSIKTALLLALTSTKRVSDLCALSIHPSCLAINGDGSSAVLRPNPTFIPKNIRSSFRSRTITLSAFFPAPHREEREESLNKLCPVRALACYVERTAAVRSTQQLFVHYSEASVGKPLSKQRLSHWLCDGIAHAYVNAGRTPPPSIRAHSTRSVAASTALFGGVSVRDICTAASWSSPCPFIRFYLMDVSQGSLTHSVLSVAAGES